MAEKDLDLYRKTLKRTRMSFACPHCKQRVLPRDYERHCSKNHRVDVRTTCVWCFKFTWRSHEKQKNAKHLLGCFKAFVFSDVESCGVPETCRDVPSTSVEAIPETRCDDPETLSEEEGMFSPHETAEEAGPVVLFSEETTELVSDPNQDSEDELFETHRGSVRILKRKHAHQQKKLLNYPDFPTAREHDLLNPLQVENPPNCFEDAHLNLAASYVLHFLNTRETHDWFHAMVKAVAFDSFVKALEKDETTRTLAFSCWCNGGKGKLAKHRQHRHLIAVAPKKHFQTQTWCHVKLPAGEKAPWSNFMCKQLKRIREPLHLVNAMGYVSHTKSRCRFSFKNLKTTTPEKEHHFYLYRTLPKEYKLPLALLWDGGVYELLYREKFQNVALPRVVRKGGMRWVGNQWRQKIKQFYNSENGLVVPVSRKWIPTNRETSRYLCLMSGKRLYFEQCAEPLDRESWLSKQVEGGNLFYEAVEEEWWTPRPRDRKVLNYYMPLVQANRKLEADMKRLRKEKQRSDEEVKMLREEKKRSDEEVKMLREEKKQSDEEVKRLYERLTESFMAQLKAKDETIAELKEQLKAATGRVY